MAFHDDVRLPVNIERDPTGGPQFNTTILKLFSGKERRNKNWSRSLGTWTVAYGVTDLSNFIDAINTFWVVNGMGDGFRMKDWSDFQIGDTLGGDTSTKQAIGTSNGIINVYQIFKSYTVASASFNRTITRPVSGTLRVFWGSTEKTQGSDWTCDYTTGLITFPVAFATGLLTLTGTPTNGDTVTIGSKVYTWQTTLTNVDGNVLIGGSTANAVTNLIEAVNLGAGSGTTYAAATTANAANVVASQGSGTTMALIAIYPGTAANSVATTNVSAGSNASWGHTTLTGGTGAVPSNGTLIYVMTEFDVPVRFDTDLLTIDVALFDSDAVGSIAQIILQELKE